MGGCRGFPGVARGNLPVQVPTQRRRPRHRRTEDWRQGQRPGRATCTASQGVSFWYSGSVVRSVEGPLHCACHRQRRRARSRHCVHRPVRSSTVLAGGVHRGDGGTHGRGRWLTSGAVRLGRHVPWLQFAFLTATAAATLRSTSWPGSGGEVLIAVLAGAAMACQNASLHLSTPSTPVMADNIVASTVGLTVGRVAAG